MFTIIRRRCVASKLISLATASFFFLSIFSSDVLALAPELRSKPFSDKTGLEFQQVYEMMRTAGKLKALIQNDEARPGNMKRLNDELKERLPGGEVEIDMELRDGVLSTGTEYKYAVFHFKKENRSIEARFFKEDVELKKKELKELGVKTTEDRRHFFNSPEHPALRGVWFVNATTAGDAKLNVQRIVTVTTADDVSKELLGEKAYKILIMAKRGLNVPSFFTIIGDGTGTLTITDEMRQLSSGMKKPMIVRSAHKD